MEILATLITVINVIYEFSYIHNFIAYYSLGNFKKAIVHYELFLKVAEEVGDRGRKRITFTNLSKAYENLRDFKRTIEYYELSFRLPKK